MVHSVVGHGPYGDQVRRCHLEMWVHHSLRFENSPQIRLELYLDYAFYTHIHSTEVFE